MKKNKISRTHHIVFALGLFERMDDKTLQECFGNEDGSTLSAEEIRAHVKGLREQGFSFHPGHGCDNYGPDGACLGHEKEVEFSNEIRS